MLFAQNLKRIREWRGLTQERLAALTGLRQSAVSNLETGRRLLPETGTLLKLARGLRTSVDELLAGVDEAYDTLMAGAPLDARALETYHELRMDVVRAVRQLMQSGKRPEDPAFATEAELLTDRLRRQRLPDWDEKRSDPDTEAPYAVPVIAEGDPPPGASGTSALGTTPVGLVLLPRSLEAMSAYGVRLEHQRPGEDHKRTMTVLVSRNAVLQSSIDAYVVLATGACRLGRVRRIGLRTIVERTESGAEPMVLSPAEIAAVHPAVAALNVDIDVAMEESGAARAPDTRLAGVGSDVLAGHDLMMRLLDLRGAEPDRGVRPTAD